MAFALINMTNGNNAAQAYTFYTEADALAHRDVIAATRPDYAEKLRVVEAILITRAGDATNYSLAGHTADVWRVSLPNGDTAWAYGLDRGIMTERFYVRTEAEHAARMLLQKVAGKGKL
jgi:hypothetical protein